MEYICIGKIVNTHGIKGELRIKSNFELKDQVFIKGFNLYVGSEKHLEVINSYRKHKDFDMVTFNNYNNINEVLKYLKENVYVLRSDLDINKYLLDDLIGMEVILNNESFGKIEEIVYNNGNKLLLVTGVKNFYIPYNDVFIKDVLANERKVLVNDIVKELII